MHRIPQLFQRPLQDRDNSSSQSGFRIDLDRCLQDYPSLTTVLHNPIVAVGATAQGTAKSKAIKSRVGQDDKVDDDNIGQAIFCIGSVSKLLINLVYCIIIELKIFKGFGWDSDACEWYNSDNSWCREDERRIVLGTRKPTILQLLLHQDAFAEINRFIFAPDGRFMISSDDFLQHISTISDVAFPIQELKSIEYSNANHMFAIIILEKMFGGRDIHWILKKYLFEPYKMTCTTTDPKELQEWRKKNSGKMVLSGHRVSGDLSRCDEVPTDLLGAASIATALFGTWSCTDDLIGLFSQLFNANDGPDNERRRVADHFFTLQATTKEYASTLAGWLCDTTSPWLGRDSLDDLSKPENSEPLYTLGNFYEWGKIKPQQIFHKGGISDGFTSSVYIAPEHKVCIVVLANSTGPIDLTTHAGQSVLQEILKLRRTDGEVNIVKKINDNMDLLCQPLRDLDNEDADEDA